MSTENEPQAEARVTYTRREMITLAQCWMVETQGSPRDYPSDPAIRDAWYRDLGLLIDFVTDQFPQ